MNILVINCGSSSLKYQLINSDTEDSPGKGISARESGSKAARSPTSRRAETKEGHRFPDADPHPGDPAGTGCPYQSRRTA